MKLPRRLKPVLLTVLFVSLLFSCAYIPEQEQLVSSAVDKPLTRSSGHCSETDFFSDISGTEPIPTGLTADNISILDWNIHKGEHQGWDSDLLDLSRAKDIVFLQEAPLNAELQQLLRHKNMYWNLNSAFKYKGVEMGVLTASSIKPLESCGLRLSEPFIGVPKTVLINRYSIASVTEELLAANIHGINISLGAGAYRQQLGALEDILEEHEGPILLVGDFNNWSDKRTTIMLQLAEKLSLQVLEFNNQARTRFFGDPVDQILYRGLEPVAQAVHPVTSSDHNPITATFRLVRRQDANE